MKTTFKTFSIAVIALSFLAVGCEKEKPAAIDQLPPATQTGANTFGCLVNGEVFKPSGSPLGGPVLSASYILYNGKYGLSIFARRGGEIQNLFISSLQRCPNRLPKEPIR